MEEEVPEKLVILKSDTIAYPGAVVVHPHDTSIANRAVVGSRRPVDITLHAEAPVDEAPDVNAEQVDHFVLD